MTEFQLTAAQRRRLERQPHTTADAGLFRRTLAGLEAAGGRPVPRPRRNWPCAGRPPTGPTAQIVVEGKPTSPDGLTLAETLPFVGARIGTFPNGKKDYQLTHAEIDVFQNMPWWPRWLRVSTCVPQWV